MGGGECDHLELSGVWLGVSEGMELCADARVERGDNEWM